MAVVSTSRMTNDKGTWSLSPISREAQSRVNLASPTSARGTAHMGSGVTDPPEGSCLDVWPRLSVEGDGMPKGQAQQTAGAESLRTSQNASLSQKWQLVKRTV